MQMLEAGGLGVHLGNGRPMYEDPRAAELPENWRWLSGLGGRAVKIVDAQRFRPPEHLPYRVVLLARNPYYQAISQMRLLGTLAPVLKATMRKEEGGLEVVERMAQSVIADRRRIRKMFSNYPKAELMAFQFEDLIEAPWTSALRLAYYVEGVADCRDLSLDVRAMRNCIMARTPEPTESMAIEMALVRELGQRSIR